VKIEGDNEPQPTIPREEGQVPFVFVGTVESISNAKVLLEYHLAHLKEVEQLRQEKLEIDQQLRSMHGPPLSLPNYPVQRRNDRGYMEMDGGRPRGGNQSRGRGRGRGGSSNTSNSRYNSNNNSFPSSDYVNNSSDKKGPPSRGGGGGGRGNNGRGGGSRRPTPDHDGNDHLPPRQYNQQRSSRDHRRGDDRRRVTDEEETVLDQDGASVASLDRDSVSSMDSISHSRGQRPRPRKRWGRSLTPAGSTTNAASGNNSDHAENRNAGSGDTGKTSVATTENSKESTPIPSAAAPPKGDSEVGSTPASASNSDTQTTAAQKPRRPQQQQRPPRQNNNKGPNRNSNGSEKPKSPAILNGTPA